MSRDAAGPDAPPGWLAEIPTGVGPPWLQMGTRAIDPAGWLVVDGERERELAEKRRLVAAHPDEVGRWEPATEAAGEEVLGLVRAWLAHHRPGTSTTPPTGARHPLEAAALLVQEDLCLVDDPGAGHRLVAGSVCFPSHWRLGEKIGLPMAAVHGPVPHYATELRRRVDRFFDRLPADRVVVRRNLSIHDHPDLFRPEPAEEYATEGDGPDGLWVRGERQTLRRLTGSGSILFTIRTQVCAVSQLAALPEVASRLADRIDAHSELARRTGEPFRAPPWLSEWLRAPDGRGRPTAGAAPT